MLPEGQTCKTDDEIKAYMGQLQSIFNSNKNHSLMGQLQLILYIKTNYIENNDIDDPLKSHFIVVESQVLNTSTVK